MSPLASAHAIGRILGRPTRSREYIGAHNRGREVSAIVQAAKHEYATLTTQQKMALEATEEVEKEREALQFLTSMPTERASTLKAPAAPVHIEKAASSFAPATPAFENLWDKTADSASTVKKSSSLFGKTIPSAPLPKPKSALFGKALPAKGKASANDARRAFEEAQRSLLTDVGSGILPVAFAGPSKPSAPAPAIVAGLTVSAEPRKAGESEARQDGGVTSGSPPTAPFKAKKDDVVQVKRRKTKPTPLARATAGPEAANKSKGKKSLAAQTTQPSEMFDYTAQPDFLSASHQRHLVEGGRDKGKADAEARKSKKAKKKAKANGPPTCECVTG